MTRPTDHGMRSNVSKATRGVIRRVIQISVSLAFLALGVTRAVSQPVNPTDDWQRILPAQAIAREVLSSSPVATEALAQRRALEARADAVQAGSAEFNVRYAQQRRRLSEVPTRYNEHNVSVERAFRAWGKAGLDADIAAQTRTLAEITQADAMHEASRSLLSRWFEHLQAMADVQLAEQQRQLAEKLSQQTQARHRHGEVSQLDASLAKADAGRALALTQAAQATLAQTTATLRAHYPALPLPLALTSELTLPALSDLSGQKSTYLEHHHELRLLRAQAERLRIVGERTARDRLPDPTLGLFNASDRDGAERIQGVSLAWPLPGSARSAQAKAAYEDALAAQSALQLAESYWSARFDAQVALVQARLKAAMELRQAARTQTEAAQKASLAYSLGEGSIAELIQIQRYAAEQRRDAQRQALEALAVWSNLQLDLHLLWDMDDTRP